MPESVMVATFPNEILRRLKTSHVGANQVDMEDIILNLMDELTAMGYTQECREKVLNAAMTGYMRLLAKVESGDAKRNRKGAETLTSRRFKRLVLIQEWFRLDRDKPDAWEVQEPWSMQGKGRNLKRAKADSRYIESIQFVPHTPGSTLRNNLTKMEQKLGFKPGLDIVRRWGGA